MECCIGTTSFLDSGSKYLKQEMEKKGSVLTRSLWNIIKTDS